jgi:hypothetical protein
MERFCNNYFNPRNDPADPTREHPQDFLGLAECIYHYRADERNAPSRIIGESMMGTYSWNAAQSYQRMDAASWQYVFAGDLAVYRRAKTI